jgi:hypothetical protein
MQGLKTSKLILPLALVLGLAGACSDKGQPDLSTEDMEGAVFKKGDKVKAPFGKKSKKISGKILDTYGKLAQIRFSNGHTGWALVKETEPVGAIQRTPESDKCEYQSGDKVNAPWSNKARRYNGTIDEIHGKMAHINYDDGDVDWVKCERLKAPTEKKSSSASGGGGGSGKAKAIQQCKRKCSQSCKGASNRSKCVGKCRRACDGK